MELTRIQKGSSVYAAYPLEQESVIDKVSMMMINNNQNHAIGLAPISIEEMNGYYTRMLFDVTGKLTLREYVRKNISQDDFRLMLMNLICTVEKFDEYMIDVQQVMMNMDCVYINTLDHSVDFLCLALQNVKQTQNLYLFFKEVVENSYVSANLNEVSYFNRVWNVIRDENGFSLKNMKIAMAAQSESPSKSNYPNEITDKPAAEIPEKTEIPETVTVTPNPVPADAIPAIPLPAPEEKKKGLLSGLFGSSKRKKTEVSTDTYRGGIAGLKNGSRTASPETALQKTMPKQVAPQQTESVQQPIPQKSNSQQMIEQAPSYGTTVLNSRMARAELPSQTAAPALASSASPMGTTVLNRSVPGSENSSHSAAVPAAGSVGTTVLNRQHQGDEGATTVLNPRVRKTACLIRVKNHERVFVNKPMILVGRDLEEADCNVHDNTNVGHRHASIVQRDGNYYIVDLNSVNHTFVNGSMISSSTEVLLSDGDEIVLADEKFTFRII